MLSGSNNKINTFLSTNLRYFYLVFCGISLVLTSCNESPNRIVGYVEGEYVLIAPIETSQIAEVSVLRGQRVEEGQPLVSMEIKDAQISEAQSQALLLQAQSQLADLQQPRRAEEIAMIEASLLSANAQLAEAQRVYKRESELLKSGQESRAKFDAASTSLQVAKAKVIELQASLKLSKLPAREELINAAEAQVVQAQKMLEHSQWKLTERTLLAPTDGVVFDVIRHTGEVAGPQAPVISFLPDGATKLRLYIPENMLSSLSIGSRLQVNCDGCASLSTATVTYISDAPEFTPPVIYSLDNQQKLVYLIEALPDDTNSRLKPGQIVDVDFSELNQ